MGRVQERGDAVEAFGGELVVGEGAEEFGDEDVDGVVDGLVLVMGVGMGMGIRTIMTRSFPTPHIRLHQMHLSMP